MAEDSLRNVRLLVAYDGTEFHGFAASDGVPTVMGKLSAEVERIVRVPVHLVGAGRTDAGVHAWGQVVSGPIPLPTDLSRLTGIIIPTCYPFFHAGSILRDAFSLPIPIPVISFL